MKKPAFLTGLLLLVGLLFILDYWDRYHITLPKFFSSAEEEYFFSNKTVGQSQDIIRSAWGESKYQLPGAEIAAVKYYPNWPIISRFAAKKLTELQKSKLISLLNTPEHFIWGETTWNYSESIGFFRFFDHYGDEMAHLWLCMDDCGMIELRPWIPTTKYGGLSPGGQLIFTELILSM